MVTLLSARLALIAKSERAGRTRAGDTPSPDAARSRRYSIGRGERKSRPGHDRASAAHTWWDLEPVLDAEGKLIGVRKAVAQFAGEATEAAVFEAKPQGGAHVVPKPESVVDAIAQPPQIGIGLRRRGEELLVVLCVAQAAVKREGLVEVPTREYVEIPASRRKLPERAGGRTEAQAHAAAPAGTVGRL